VVASDSTHVSAWDQNLFTEWHSRCGGRGVLIYWSVEKGCVVVHSQLLRTKTGVIVPHECCDFFGEPLAKRP
jgi:TnpA family transposase